MARPSKTRLVCRIPHCQEFNPANSTDASITLLLTLEEYETIRLMDYCGNSQQEAADQMGISRGTLQAIYAEARRKLARFLVEGTQLKIEGGSYELCSTPCHSSTSGNRLYPSCVPQHKGEWNMKIAVTYENGQVFQHFGHTEQFKVYNVENGAIVSTEIVDTNGQGHGALAGFLLNSGISVLICGGIGGGARNALTEAGIELYPGASGDADAQVASFLQGKLQYNPDTMCNHHSHEEGHSCGDRGCGSSSCH